MSGFEFDDKAYRRALEAEVAAMTTRSGAVVAQIGEAVARTARSLAPERTGRLRRSIKNTPGRDARGPYADVSVGAFYASFVEYGTSREAARPFMRPAQEAARATTVRLSRRVAK